MAKKKSLRGSKAKQMYDFSTLLSDDRYDLPSLYKRMNPEAFTMEYYEEKELKEVIVFNCKPELLGMKMVSDQFTARDVVKWVGKDLFIRVFNVMTHKSIEMRLEDYVKYFENPKKDRILNSLSLECSDSALSDLIEPPTLVRQIDWAYQFPDERRNRQFVFKRQGYKSHPNYPCVEKFCLLSPAGSFTEFHIDFLGSSVWYHVKTGKKIFFIIEPTTENVDKYEKYMESKSKKFFGELVDKCARVVVEAGNTLILPSGWLHAVYTPEDSMVFGGNYLHSHAITMQLKVAEGEERMEIDKTYRYPMADEVGIFVMNNIIKNVTSREYIRPYSRNQQKYHLEYVGDLFRKENDHHRMPIKTDYASGGKVWKKKWKETEEYTMWMKRGFEGTKKDKDNDKNKKVVHGVGDGDGEDMEANNEKKICEKTVDWFPDSKTFFHPESFGLDSEVETDCHIMPISCKEPTLEMDKDKLLELITPKMITEYETLAMHYINRSEVNLPNGLTRFNSFMATFCEILRKRRHLAEIDGVNVPVSILVDGDVARLLRKDRKRKTGEENDEYEPKSKKGKKGGGYEGRVTRSMTKGLKKASNRMK